MIVLPTNKVPATSTNPHFLIIYGRPKSGKTSSLAQLEGNLIIDLEGGSTFIDALAVQARDVNTLGEIAQAIRAKNSEVGHSFYKRITIDNATRCVQLVLYFYIRQAVRKVIDMFRDLCDEFILVGHVKDVQVDQNGEELSEMALDLVGKLSSIICGEADAVGYLYRKGNETHISFKGGDGTIKEARAPHLRGKDIVIAKGNDDGTITTDWKQIYK